jgi:xylan 1,4-beta-xylosidase
MKNPILKGFKPDPSILRVGDIYYIATSTFAWFPALNLFSSKDLSNWKQIASPLQNAQALDLIGLDASCGIWAPNLSYKDGVYYIVCTVVETNHSRFKDPRNFIIQATDIDGPWSNPSFLNCSGWDPSLFHDDDGRSFLLNMLLDWRPEQNRFAGVVMQEIDLATKTLIGSSHYLYAGTGAGFTEGPNLYKIQDFFYLVLAEGGTGFSHRVSLARTHMLLGPYVESPYNPMMTSHPIKGLQRAGHGSLVRTLEGRWYLAHLCSRSLERQYSILGRETALQEVHWTDDHWPVLSAIYPQDTIADLPSNEGQSIHLHLTFPSLVWSPQVKTLREGRNACGIDETSRTGWLRIHGGNSLSSKFRQHLIAFAQESFSYQTTTLLECRPRGPRHLAGLFAYYNNDNYYYAYVRGNDRGDAVLGVVAMNNTEFTRIGIELEAPEGPIYLRSLVMGATLLFAYSIDGLHFKTMHPNKLDMRHLSDEYILGNGFTGSMVGIGCQDLQGDGFYADFRFLTYEEMEA